jgi:D-3-phosphoglycerate dehydrogenase
MKAVAELRATADLRLNPHDRIFTLPELVEAARDCDVIITDRQTPGPTALFESLPNLVAFQRSQVDIRNIDVDAWTPRAPPVFL